MKKILIASLISCLGIIACKTKTTTTTFANQLQKNFQSRLWKTDSSLMLDSFSILRIDTANQRLIDKVQDTTYKLTLYNVQAQLANAKAGNKTDSMAFYQEELDYMIPTSDSLAKLARARAPRPSTGPTRVRATWRRSTTATTPATATAWP